MRPILPIVAVLGLAAGAAGGDWPHWRGPNHDGVSPEKGLRTTWDAPPPKVWEREIGPAFSSFACVGDRVYTCGTSDKQQTLLCLKADTGDVLWKRPFELRYHEPQGGDGTRATPAVHDGRVFIIGALGRLLCASADTGEEVWSRQFDAKPQWGYSGSVLVENGLVIVPVGGPDAALLALDVKTGKEVWKCGSGVVGYATPYPITLDGRRYVVGFMGKEAIIGEADTGRTVWNLPWQTDWDVNAATPIFHDGHLLLSSGYKHGSTLLKLRREGDRLAATPVWENNNIRAKFQTPVLYEGHLYVSDEVGLKCVEWATGNEKWSRRGTQNGTVLVADGQLLVFTEDGTLLIAPATPAEFKPTAEVQLLDGRCWTVPVLHRGHLYVRNLKRAACFRLTE